MAVWLKCGVAELAFDGDIVPREALARLASLDDIEARARADAAAVRAAAEADAEALADKARRDALAVTRLGHAQGRRDALRHWHAQAGAQRAAARARHGSLREQLADMVVQATASLLQGPLLASYLDSALQALDALAEKDQALSVTLHPLDRTVAQEAIDRLRPHWREGTVVKLVEDDSLARGSCICESPQGYIDGSLALQLATLRQAALGALEGLELPEDILEAPQSVAEPVVPTGPGSGLAFGAVPSAGLPPDPFPDYTAAYAQRGPGGFDEEDDFDEEAGDEDGFDEDLDSEDEEALLLGNRSAAPRPGRRRPW